MDLNLDQYAYMQDVDRYTRLANMRHSEGWEVFVQFGEDKMRNLQAQLIRKDGDKDEIYAAHQKLQGVMEFWNSLVELVENAERLSDPNEVRIRLYSLSQNADVD